MKGALWGAALWVLGAWALAGCPAAQAASKPWTVLIYMNVDDSLKPYAFWDLYDMEAAFSNGLLGGGSTGKTDILVQLDDDENDLSSRYRIFQSTTPFKKGLQEADFLKYSESQIQSPLVSQGREENFGDSPEARLRSFLEWGTRFFPARHYVAVIWGHGLGWHSDALAVGLPFSTFFQDDMVLPPFFDFRLLERVSVHATFDTVRLGSALRAAAAFLGRPIDILVSDACLMQTVEVDDELAGSVKYIVGSSQILPYHVVPYRELFYEMNAGFLTEPRPLGDDPALALALSLPAMSRFFSRDDESREWLTMSSVDGGFLQRRLAPSLQILGEALSDYINEDNLRSVVLEQVIQDTPAFLGSARDLGLFLANLKDGIIGERQRSGAVTPASHAVELAIATVQNSLKEAVVGSVIGSHYGGGSFSGINVWLPETGTEYDLRSPEFEVSRFYKQGGWAGWLRKLHP